MPPKSDAQLLKEYAQNRGEAAFAELVERHTNLVYSAALRQVEVSDQAKDVAQKVFADLAAKAASLSAQLSDQASVVGWLYHATRLEALSLRREEFRRQARERQAMQEPSSVEETAVDWLALRPVLDEAMAALNEPDREAILLRFFQNQNFRAVGTALGVSDDTAQKRVTRAVEKLRESLSRRGIKAAAGVLGLTISANAVQAAPVALAATITTSAITGAATLTAVTLTKTIAMTTLQKILVSAGLAAAVGFGVYEAREASRARALAGQHADQLDQLRSERDDLAAKLNRSNAEQSQSQSNVVELARLRNEVARLRTNVHPPDERPATPAPVLAAAANPPPAPRNIPKDSWTDAGFATPEDALRTRGWAIVNGERERFKESIHITDSARKTMEDMLLKMMEDSKDPGKAKLLQEVAAQKLGVEEGILMPLMAQNKALDFTGYRIMTEEAAADDKRLLQVETGAAKGPSRTETLKLQRFGGDWKVVIDDDFIKLMTGGR